MKRGKYSSKNEFHFVILLKYNVKGKNRIQKK